MSKRETCDVVWCVSLRADNSRFCAIHRKLEPKDPSETNPDKWRRDAVQANNAARRRAEKEAQRLEEERLKQANSGRK
jgi:hypothetical protein